MPAATTVPTPRTAAGGGSSRAQEDYLEQIFNLIEEKGYARVVDVEEDDFGSLRPTEPFGVGHLLRGNGRREHARG